MPFSIEEDGKHKINHPSARCSSHRRDMSDSNTATAVLELDEPAPDSCWGPSEVLTARDTARKVWNDEELPADLLAAVTYSRSLGIQVEIRGKDQMPYMRIYSEQKFRAMRKTAWLMRCTKELQALRSKKEVEMSLTHFRETAELQTEQVK